MPKKPVAYQSNHSTGKPPVALPTSETSLHQDQRKPSTSEHNGHGNCIHGQLVSSSIGARSEESFAERLRHARDGLQSDQDLLGGDSDESPAWRQRPADDHEPESS